MARIAITDDDDFFRESLEQNLSDCGFEVATFARGEELLDHVAAGGGIDLILLDWKMPGMTGINVLHRLREAEMETPVIFLTALDDQIYEEAALNSGAVDFVEKSRSFQIVRSRIELILEGLKGRGPGAGADGDDAQLVIGELDLRPASRRAYWRGSEVGLTLGEFGIVHCLAARKGSDVRYRDLYDAVRESGFIAGAGPEGYRTNVRTFIKRIRRKFRDIDPDFDQIENYAGFGYRWRHD